MNNHYEQPHLLGSFLLPLRLPRCRVADWFAQMNNKMGGDLKKIQVVGRYLVEIWKAVGMNMERVQFLSASGGFEAGGGPECAWRTVVGAGAVGWGQAGGRQAGEQPCSWPVPVLTQLLPCPSPVALSLCHHPPQRRSTSGPTSTGPW